MIAAPPAAATIDPLPDPPADPDMPDHLRAEFFEAVRAIIAAAGLATDGAVPGGPAIGGDARPEDEPVRFVAMRGARHPDAELGTVTQAATGPVRIEAAFMGLTGPTGVMPDHYTELVVARDRARDAAFGEFLDLFNHRAISLFYRAWAKYRLPVAFAETKGSLTDPVSRALAALAGLNRPGDDPRILGAAGLLARRVRSPDALRRTLATLYGLPVAVIELRPRRIRIAPDEQTRIGGGRPPKGRKSPGRAATGAYARLAANAVLGAATTDVAGRFRVTIGPLDRARFDGFFTPDGLHRRIVATIRQVAGATADFDIQLILARDAVPRTRLDGTARLGQASWLLHGPATHDRTDAVLPGRS